uniref:Uncharacterized protein n=1 Tax=Lactuca sativa TaxID=4236 RepID=A0A9R1VCU8_LACSA|nr:hypothetical protein LSAT_V11C500297030 [Lactuca sativa]
MASQIRNYNTWTNSEEAKLVEALVNMANVGGFKFDNGFKLGYSQHLEQALKQSLPDLGIIDLCIVFGKDRAQGSRVIDFIEMEQDVNLEKEMLNDFIKSEEISHNTTMQNEETSPSVRSNKRKCCIDDVFHNAVGLITKSLKEISKDLSKGIKFDMKIN